MKIVAAALLATASLCLLGCPDQTAATPTKEASSAAPAQAPSAAASAKPADTAGGW